MKNDIGYYAKIEKLLEQMEKKNSKRNTYLLGCTKVEFKDRQPFIDKARKYEESRNKDKQEILDTLKKIDDETVNFEDVCKIFKEYINHSNPSQDIMILYEFINKIYTLKGKETPFRIYHISNDDEEKYCWNCEYFSAPYGCSNIFGFATPFDCCNDWSEADGEYIQTSKDKIDECCVVNRLKSLKGNIGLIKTHKKELNKSIDKILEIIEAVNND